MDDVERLRRFCVDHPALVDGTGDQWAEVLDPRTAALVRIGALIAVSAPAASMRSALDEAVAAGVSLREILAVLDGMVSVVGLPRAVAAAPRIASALGYADDIVPESDL
ncbi:carboxymuconolactone decarboxylase family protein [Microbacterium sp. M3]|uniref:Carboxymuconolactone decarboxylase family protein n=1 Tax=Microbacterium arthrosphaerae TaxID=792652 RepID=A0ABU4H306_9MICO|nr:MULTISPECIES: carboxymuconolactone decarboxylase family protein [Microbacterium]MDW4573703.1 carboxymuconolactone decarboxylase family protein [Microbacterium arthrosphaerae]MDW7607558.1 carboxymuconolactone decarboxylase family protein [Microbacterium sp. M3]